MLDLQLTLCERFPSLTPFIIRRERLYDVFNLVRRLNNQNSEEYKKNENTQEKRIKKVNGKTRVYVPIIS